MAEPTHLPYYHPNISTSESAKRYLLGHMEQGSFILRQSSSSTHSQIKYSLSVVYNEKMIHHVPIQTSGPRYYLIRGEEFNTIDELVFHYSKVNIPNNDYKSLRLIHAVGNILEPVLDTPPPRPPKPQWTRKDLPPTPISSPQISKKTSFERMEIANISGHNFAGQEAAEQKPARPPKPGYGSEINQAVRNFEKDFRDYPLPIPEDCQVAAGICSQLSKYISKADEENIYDTYSRIDSTPVDRTHELIKMLNDLEAHELQHMKCDCGIYHKDSLLPDGWTVHRSKEPATAGQLFFTSGDGVTTSWTLPDKVWYQLRPEHVTTLKDLADAYGVAVPSPVKYLLKRKTSAR